MTNNCLPKIASGLKNFANTTVRTKISASMSCNTPESVNSVSHRSITLKSKCKLWKMIAVIALIISICIVKDQFKE